MIKTLQKNPQIIWPILVMAVVIVYFVGFFPAFGVEGSERSRTMAGWATEVWQSRNDMLHAWFVPIICGYLIYQDRKKMELGRSSEKVGLGLVILLLGIVSFLVAIRVNQQRVLLLGVPFMIVGGGIYLVGWRAARFLLFPAFFWYFAMPVPMLQQATNGLQVLVTKSCYLAGQLVGMNLVSSGNEIYSADGSWNFDIAEGCSGIRSLMSLVMIAAIYGYMSQRILWKKAALFLAAFPLALVGNFFRIFTILILAEMGYEDVARKSYHDWAGLLLFFPVALFGLFILDKALKGKLKGKKVKVTKVD